MRNARSEPYDFLPAERPRFNVAVSISLEIDDDGNVGMIGVSMAKPGEPRRPATAVHSSKGDQDDE